MGQCGLCSLRTPTGRIGRVRNGCRLRSVRDVASRCSTRTRPRVRRTRQSGGLSAHPPDGSLERSYVRTDLAGYGRRSPTGPSPECVKLLEWGWKPAEPSRLRTRDDILLDIGRRTPAELPIHRQDTVLDEGVALHAREWRLDPATRMVRAAALGPVVGSPVTWCRLSLEVHVGAIAPR